jgi:putative membrane protein
MSVHELPAINASLNGLSAIFIVVGWWLIRHQRTRAHITVMVCALVSSTIFLICYVTYHYLRGGVVTRFTAEGFIRPVYFALLISHTILAVVTVPLVIATVVPALQARYDRHRRLVPWALPIWLYVSVTGVLVYMMLYHWFPPAS